MKSDYFIKSEFACNCCGLSNMSRRFMKLLDIARIYAKIPFVITSGSRCRKHNHDEGGHPESYHIATIKHESEACDIVANTDRKRYIIINSLMKAGFVHIGAAKEFIHVDLSETTGLFLYK